MMDEDLGNTNTAKKTSFLDDLIVAFKKHVLGNNEDERKKHEQEEKNREEVFSRRKTKAENWAALDE